MNHILSVNTSKKKEIIDLTKEIEKILQSHEKEVGVCTVFVMHTTACITTGEIGEGTGDDLLEVAEKIIPKINFRHAHDPSHARTHMASSLIGPSLTIPFKDKKLLTGTWQSVLLIELDGPRERNVVISI